MVFCRRTLTRRRAETIAPLLLRTLSKSKNPDGFFSCFRFGEVVDFDELKGSNADLQV
jgi:hypothetical protein